MTKGAIWFLRITLNESLRTHKEKKEEYRKDVAI